MNTNSFNNSNSMNNSNNKNNKKPTAPKAKLIAKSKYFKVSTRDSSRIKNIKEGMNHLFDIRNRELEEAFLQEASQYTERILGESRRINFSEEEDHEAMDVIFNNSIEELIGGAGLSAEDEEETDSEEVLALQERIQQEDQEEYDRIRAEMEEEEAEANKNN